MNSTINTFIKFVLTVIIFSSALFYALNPLYEVGKEFEDSLGTNGTVYEKQTEIPKQPTFKGSEIISSMYKLDFNGIVISVNGVIYETMEDVLLKQSLIDIQQHYTQLLEYNADGSVKRVTYIPK